MTNTVNSLYVAMKWLLVAMYYSVALVTDPQHWTSIRASPHNGTNCLKSLVARTRPYLDCSSKLLTCFCCYNYRKLQGVELENLVLQNPSSRAYRMQQLGLSATLGTSGRGASRQGSNVSLLPSVHLIRECDLIGSAHRLGAGRFGTCYVQSLAHFRVCVKVFKHADARSVCNEANILSNFKSKFVPYLFGVIMGTSNQAIVTSFHGFGDVSVTLHYALSTKSSNVFADCAVDWKLIIQQIVEGVDCLHVKYRVLHNDLKSDNIVIAPASVGVPFQVVIIDFGKACAINCGSYIISPFSEGT